MNRKYFLSLLPASLFFSPFKVQASSSALSEHDKYLKIPKALVAGDKIGITCPAGYITQAEIDPSIIQMKSWGFDVVIGKTVGARDFTFGGSDKERLDDLQEMLDDSGIKAIMCARGGYGVIRIIDQLDFSTFRSSPKWLIGFSDITILHSHINSRIRVATLHSKMCNSFPSDWGKAEPIQIATINSIEQSLKGLKQKFVVPYATQNKMGKCSGEVIGGNLRCIENLAGSKSEIQTDGKILFVEDTGEYLYSIDRMFYNLKRSGKLEKLSGLIVGGFKVKVDSDDTDPFGKTLMEIVLEKVKEYNYPVCFNFPVGHQRANFALKCGVNHRLEVWESGSQLQEL